MDLSREEREAGKSKEMINRPEFDQRNPGINDFGG